MDFDRETWETSVPASAVDVLPRAGSDSCDLEDSASAGLFIKRGIGGGGVAGFVSVSREDDAIALSATFCRTAGMREVIGASAAGAAPFAGIALSAAGGVLTAMG